jgi:hypothetical protein
MRPELAAAERNAAVRNAARAWRKAGVIDESAFVEIESRYPDDRVSKSTIWRALIFVFSSVIIASSFGLIGAISHPSRDGLTMLALFFGVVLAITTEIEQGPLRFDGTGGEAATSLLSLTFLIVAAFHVLEPPFSPFRIGWLLILAAILFAAGSWRWGFPVYALFSAVAVFFSISTLVPFPRIAWIALAALLVLLCGRLQDHEDLAPAQREGVTVLLAVALAAAYAAFNLYSLDQGAIEEVRPGPSAARLAWPLARALSIAATALYPIGVMIAGVKTRSRLLIDLGIGFSALSLVTLRAYVHLGPLWLVLTEAGVGLVLLAFGTERFLARGRDRERAGLTAEPLFEDARRTQLLSAAAVVTTVSPDATTAGLEKGFSAGGGGFGGGDASGDL